MKSQFTKEYQIVIEALANARREKGITQKVVAERLGKPQSFVSKYESGERRIDVCEFVAIAKAIEANPIVLLRSVGLVE